MKIENLVNYNSIINTNIQNINISRNENYTVDVRIVLQDFHNRSTIKYLEIDLFDVVKIDFHHDSIYQFGIIERYKLFITEDDNIYFSFDPYDEKNIPNIKDQDIFIAKLYEMKAHYKNKTL